MKRTKVLSVLAVACTLAATGCKDNVSSGKETFTVETVNVSAVQSSGASRTISTKEEAESVIAVIKDDAAIKTVLETFSGLFTISGKNSRTYENIRAEQAVTIDTIVSDFMAAGADFGEQLGTGASTLRFNKSYGNISGLPEGTTLSIPLFNVNLAVSTIQTGFNAAGSFRITALATADFGSDASIGKANSNSSVNCEFSLTSNMQPENEDSTEPLINGEYYIDFQNSTGLSVCAAIDDASTLGGKVLITTKLSVKFSDITKIQNAIGTISAFNEDTDTQTTADLLETILAETGDSVKIDIYADVYDDNNKLVAPKVIEITTVDELKDLFA